MHNKILIVTLSASFLMAACTTNNELTKVETKKTIKTQSIDNGKAIYKASCVKCHSSEVYTRTNRTVKSFASLQQRVAKCNVNVGANLSEREVATLSKYLNTTYYKFK